MAKKRLAARQRGEVSSNQQYHDMSAERSLQDSDANLLFGWIRKLIRLRFEHDVTGEEPDDYACEGLIETYFNEAGFKYKRSLFRSLHADDIGIVFRIKSQERDHLRCWKLKPYDLSWRQVKARLAARDEATKTEKERLKKEKQRRANGVRPQSESFSQTKPWLYFGISRRQWERRGQPMPPVGWMKP